MSHYFIVIDCRESFFCVSFILAQCLCIIRSAVYTKCLYSSTTFIIVQSNDRECLTFFGSFVLSVREFPPPSYLTIHWHSSCLEVKRLTKLHYYHKLHLNTTSTAMKVFCIENLIKENASFPLS